MASPWQPAANGRDRIRPPEADSTSSPGVPAFLTTNNGERQFTGIPPYGGQDRQDDGKVQRGEDGERSWEVNT